MSYELVVVMQNTFYVTSKSVYFGFYQNNKLQKSILWSYLQNPQALKVSNIANLFHPSFQKFKTFEKILIPV